jgi:hypothetical protein
MSTATYRPTSDSSVLLIPFGSGSGNYGRVNEVSEDVTNGVYDPVGYTRIDVYGFGLSNLGTINSITVYARCACDTGGTTGTVRLINNNGTAYYSGYNTLTSTDSTYSYTFTTNLAWTNIFGLELNSQAGKISYTSYCYQFWIVVDYTPAIPTVTTQTATVVTSYDFTGNGNITNLNGSTVTIRGFCYKVGTTGDPTISDSIVSETSGGFSTGAYSLDVGSLSESTSYRVAAFATSSGGTGYGSTVQVVTYSAVPTVTTQAATSVGATDFTGNGTIISDGGYATTLRGVCYILGTSGNPTIYDNVVSESGAFSPGAYTENVHGLTPLDSYMVSAYAINSAGVGYGSPVQVNMLVSNPFQQYQIYNYISPILAQ